MVEESQVSYQWPLTNDDVSLHDLYIRWTFDEFDFVTVWSIDKNETAAG